MIEFGRETVVEAFMAAIQWLFDNNVTVNSCAVYPIQDGWAVRISYERRDV